MNIFKLTVVVLILSGFFMQLTEASQVSSDAQIDHSVQQYTQMDRYLSAGGQEYIPLTTLNLARTSPYINKSALDDEVFQVNGQPTYTYLRCYYKTEKNVLYPSLTVYKWGVNPNGGYYKVQGVWYSKLGLANMFYTNTSHDTLAQICAYTLQKDGQGEKPFMNYFVANGTSSLDYTVWTNDPVTQDNAINKIVVFGDSLSDNGNLFNSTEWILPVASDYAHGHFTNGQVWAEYLGEKLNLPVYDWAVGKAVILPDGIIRLSEQVNSWNAYRTHDKNYHPKNTLFTIWIGANDMLNSNKKPVSSMIQQEMLMIRRLIKNEAKNIIIINLPDMTLTPYYQFRSDRAIVSARIKQFNVELKIAVVALQAEYGLAVNLHVFDVASLYENLFKNPIKYGFINSAESCLKISTMTVPYVESVRTRSDCRDPNTFLSWDLIHPTTQVHKLLAEKIELYIKRNFFH
jgi:thermolabile hemolysin